MHSEPPLKQFVEAAHGTLNELSIQYHNADSFDTLEAFCTQRRRELEKHRRVVLCVCGDGDPQQTITLEAGLGAVVEDVSNLLDLAVADRKRLDELHIRCQDDPSLILTWGQEKEAGGRRLEQLQQNAHATVHALVCTAGGALMSLTSRAPVSSDPPNPPAPFQFEKLGGVWHIRFKEEQTQIGDEDLEGLAYVARLLASPDKAVKATDLSPAPVSVRLSEKPHDLDLAYSREGQDRINAQRQRLQNELDDALELGQADKAQELKEALDALEEFHRKDQAKSGKPRRINNTPEWRADDRVRKAIAAVRKKLHERGLSSLADHLEKHIEHSERSFTYRPEKPAPAWVIRI
jgi:hypothetical protein